PALCENPPPLFFVENSRECVAGFEVGLVAADDPVPFVLAAILNARIAIHDSIGQPQLEIVDQSVPPDQEGISLSGVLGSRLTGNYSFLNRPEFRIAVPACQILSVEEALETRFDVGCGVLRIAGTGRGEENQPDKGRQEFERTTEQAIHGAPQGQWIFQLLMG